LAASPTRLNWSRLLTVGSATVLIAVEVIAGAVAGGWALAGLFGLGDIGAYVLEALGGLLALWVVVSFFRAANRHEPIFERGSPGQPLIQAQKIP
jgi:hypothetical protein